MFMEVRTKLSALLLGVVTDYAVQGARWDSNLGSIAESRLKELYPAMPVPQYSVLVYGSVLHCGVAGDLHQGGDPGQAGAAQSLRVSHLHH